MQPPKPDQRKRAYRPRRRFTPLEIRTYVREFEALPPGSATNHARRDYLTQHHLTYQQMKRWQTGATTPPAKVLGRPPKYTLAEKAKIVADFDRAGHERGKRTKMLRELHMSHTGIDRWRTQVKAGMSGHTVVFPELLPTETPVAPPPPAGPLLVLNYCPECGADIQAMNHALTVAAKVKR